MVEQKKEEFMSQIEHYRAVLEDLQRQRNEYRLKINEIDQAIGSLHRLIPENAKPDLPALPFVTQPKNGASQITSKRFSDMSVRWAILYLLSEIAVGPMSTGEIAATLQEGGITSTAKSFASNVSAILSVMANEKGEVQTTDNKWIISPIGRQAWGHISAKREAEAHQQSMLSSNVH